MTETPVNRSVSTQSTRGLTDRSDFSFGGGYRRLFGEEVLLGVNAFYDTTRLNRKWYSSGSLGLEARWLISGGDGLDLTVNWYGNLLDRQALTDAFRKGPANFDIQAGYSHQAWSGGPDLRLHATGYRFATGSGVYGWRAGLSCESCDRRFRVTYEAGQDPISKLYHTVGANVTVGFDLGRLPSGENPFSGLAGICRERRTLRRELEDPPHRRFHQPVPVIVVTRSQGSSSCDTNLQGCPGRFCLSGSLSQLQTTIVANIPAASFQCAIDNYITAIVLELCVADTACAAAGAASVFARISLSNNITADTGPVPAGATGYLVSQSDVGNLGSFNEEVCSQSLPVMAVTINSFPPAPCLYEATYRMTFY